VTTPIVFDYGDPARFDLVGPVSLPTSDDGVELTWRHQDSAETVTKLPCPAGVYALRVVLDLNPEDARSVLLRSPMFEPALAVLGTWDESVDYGGTFTLCEIAKVYDSTWQTGLYLSNNADPDVETPSPLQVPSGQLYLTRLV
jgi:hypothetical protein